MRMLIVMVGLLLIASPCSAELHNNVPDQLGDIFSGKGNTYIGAEITHIPFLGPTSLTAWADVMAGEIDEGIRRDVRGGVRVVVDLEKLFK